MLMSIEPSQPGGGMPGPSSRLPYQILLVSNDPIVIEAMASAVRAEGHVPTITSSGEEALRCIHSQHYDLIAAKFDMPRMNGEELASWVKALLPRQPFILVMNERDRSNPNQRSAADLVLRKPFSLQEAREAFYKLLEPKTQG
jgi:CheY-like chemotaxis protein